MNIGRAIAGNHEVIIEQFGVNCGCGVGDGAVAAHMRNFASPTGFVQFLSEGSLQCGSDLECARDLITAALQSGDVRLAVRSGNQEEIVWAMYDMLRELFEVHGQTSEESIAIFQY